MWFALDVWSKLDRFLWSPANQVAGLSHADASDQSAVQEAKQTIIVGFPTQRDCNQSGLISQSKYLSPYAIASVHYW